MSNAVTDSDKDALNGRRVPAEWEWYDTVMIAWPHPDTDWHPMLDEVTECYRNLLRAITVESNLRALVVVPERYANLVPISDYPNGKVILFHSETNDTWTRDYGPITVELNGEPKAMDFCFNGWGLKFAANHDNMVNINMMAANLLQRDAYRQQLGFVMEGGSMETDGRGTMLSTTHCLLSLNRNGIVTKEQLAEFFGRTLGMKRLLMLNHGHLAGDDTDSHIDTLARMAPDDTIVYVKSYNSSDPHTEELDRMEAELQAMRTADGKPYNLVALPLPDPIYDENNERLPATYANFLITPYTILMPTYGQTENDRLAEQMLRVAFANRKIVGVDCRALIRQHGSLHCATMQLNSKMLAI